MDKQKYPSEFSYGKTEYFISFGPFLIMGISIPLIIDNIFTLLLNFDTRILIEDYWIKLFVLVIGLVIVLLIGPAIANQHNKIHVNRNGLRVRVFYIFFYRWITVPWQDIISVYESNTQDRWKNTLWVIKVKKLTLWHKYLGAFTNSGKYPVILVSSDMKNREDLLELVREHTKF